MPKIIFNVAFMAAGLAAVGAFAEISLPAGSASTDTALFSLNPAGSWTAGARFEREHREIRHSGTVLDLEANRLALFLTHSPLSWIAVTIGAGAAEADIKGREGEYGIDWHAGARIGILEHVLDRSPVRGRTSLLRLDTALDFRRAQSNFPDSNFHWQEWRLIPSVSYLKSMPARREGFMLDPDATALHAGMVFSWLDGRLDGASLRENRNFGLLLGADARLADSWTLFAQGIAFQASELSFSIGIRRPF